MLLSLFVLRHGIETSTKFRGGVEDSGTLLCERYQAFVRNRREGGHCALELVICHVYSLHRSLRVIVLGLFPKVDRFERATTLACRISHLHCLLNSDHVLLNIRINLAILSAHTTADSIQDLIRQSDNFRRSIVFILNLVPKVDLIFILFDRNQVLFIVPALKLLGDLRIQNIAFSALPFDLSRRWRDIDPDFRLDLQVAQTAAVALLQSELIIVHLVYVILVDASWTLLRLYLRADSVCLASMFCPVMISSDWDHQSLGLWCSTCAILQANIQIVSVEQSWRRLGGIR